MSDPGKSGSTNGHTHPELRPAFASRAQAVCFLVLVASVLLLPQLITWSGLIGRRHSYELMSENHGAYSFVATEIFDNPEDIDILFLGSSIMFSGVDTPQVQKALSEDLGRPARVVTFGHYFNSIDVLYVQLKDVLERKRVRMVVLSIPRMPYTDGPSTTGCRFVRYSDIQDIFDELPLRYKTSLYACALLRSPRDLLTIVRKNRISPSSFAENLGMDQAEIGWGRDPAKFSNFVPASPSIPGEAMIFSDRTKDRFHFTDDEVPFYQNLFLKKLVEMCRRKQVPLAMLNIPQHAERYSDTIVERKNWKETFGADVPVIGVEPAVLFAGLSDDEVEKLRFDDVHFNANGSVFFTKTVLPAILEVYKTHAAKNY